MSIDVHTLSLISGSSPLAHGDRMGVLFLPQTAYAAGSSAGATSTVAITGLPAPSASMITAPYPSNREGSTNSRASSSKGRMSG